MGRVKVILPKMGESVAEATITAWLKEVGDKVEMEEGILEIATDKVDSEIPAPQEGILLEKLCAVGDVVQIGTPVAIIETEGEDEFPQPEEPDNSTSVEVSVAKSIPGIAQLEQKVDNILPEQSGSKRFYSPLVKNIAKQENISLDELATIPGTGLHNRLTKDDILAYIKSGKPRLSVSTIVADNTLKETTPPQKSPTVYVSGEDEIIEMDRVRKLIAKHMLHSTQVAPHVTSFVEADVTNLVKWRDKIKDAYFKKEGYKITFMPIFIEAIAKSLRDFPMVNISIDGDKIIKKKNINIGMAAAQPNGNLIVPVVKNADKLNLIGIAESVNELTNKARNYKLTQDDVQGGTFTLTNAGSFGNVMGTPIINQPEVAILAVGVIQKKPAVLETSEGDVIAIRHKIFLSMSYDHRVVDGMLGGSFLKRVSDYLENFDVDRKIW